MTEQITDAVSSMSEGTRLMVLAPVVRTKKGFHKDVFTQALKRGIRRARVDGELTIIVPGMALSRYHEHTIELVMGGLAAKNRAAIVARALEEGDGSLIVLKGKREEIFSRHGICPACGIGLEKLDPRLFSFNSRQGACPACHGLGQVGGEDDAPRETCPRCQGERVVPFGLGTERLEAELQRHVPAARIGRVDRDTTRRRGALVELLERFELASKASSRVEWLSGGEAQRSAICRALINQPQMLIADEPTANLDSRLSQEFMHIVADLRRSGKSVLLSSHDPLVFDAPEVDRVVRLRDGLVEDSACC